MTPREWIALGAGLDVAGVLAFLAVTAFAYLRLTRAGSARLQRLGDGVVMALPVFMGLLIPSVLAFNAAFGATWGIGFASVFSLVLLTMMVEFSPGARTARRRLVQGCAP